LDGTSRKSVRCGKAQKCKLQIQPGNEGWKEIIPEGSGIRRYRTEEEETSGKKKSLIESGGAIKEARVKNKEKTLTELKVEQALAADSQKGGKIVRPRMKRSGPSKRRYHDFRHKYFMENLTGKGGRLDSRECNEAMHHIMSGFHPSIYNSYLKGKVVDLPRFDHDHPIRTKASRSDPIPHIIDRGGSIKGHSHSQNGLLMPHHGVFFHNTEFH